MCCSSHESYLIWFALLYPPNPHFHVEEMDSQVQGSWDGVLYFSWAWCLDNDNKEEEVVGGVGVWIVVLYLLFFCF